MQKMKYKNRLRLLRKKFQRKQDQVSEDLQINKRTLGNYELGRTAIPSDKLVEFAKYYGCSIDYILFLKDSPE